MAELLLAKLPALELTLLDFSPAMHDLARARLVIVRIGYAFRISVGDRAMEPHEARVSWSRNGAAFLDRRYSRAHEWAFDGGATIRASAAPANVPAPYSVPEAVDPEEALVAAVSSCHMLWFLAIAAKRGFVVDSYVDNARGLIAENGAGKRAFTRITLDPRIEFSGGEGPSSDELDAMHREAHGECFIASSLTCDIVVAAAGAG